MEKKQSVVDPDSWLHLEPLLMMAAMAIILDVWKKIILAILNLHVGQMIPTMFELNLTIYVIIYNSYPTKRENIKYDARWTCRRWRITVVDTNMLYELQQPRYLTRPEGISPL